MLIEGIYSSDTLIEIIESKLDVKISFASKNFKNQNFEIKSSTLKVSTILKLIFDPLLFDFVIRPNKILIKKKAAINANSTIVTMSGFVEDLESGERLISADVFIPGTGYGTTTNTFGFYSLSFPYSDSIIIVAQLIGYSPLISSLIERPTENVDFLLRTEDALLNEVVINVKESAFSKTQMSTVKLNADQIKAMPAFMGEVDVLKAVKFLAGVQSVGEGSVNYIVRGGNPDQNLILLDGVPVYNVSHLFGIFSVFNIDAIKHVELTKGGFPAHFGGRLSSVLEVNMKEGNLKEFHGSGGFGLLSAKLALEGPIVKDKASFMISGRRTYSDLIYRPFLTDGLDAGYYFTDLNAKVNWKLNKKNRLYLSFYNGLDKAFDKEDPQANSAFDAELKWGNYTSALRWNHLFSSKLFGNLTATFSRFNFQIGSFYRYDSITTAINYFSRITDYGIKYDFDYQYSNVHSIKTGISYTYHNFKPGALSLSTTASSLQDLDSILNLAPPTFTNDFSLYIEDSWTINQRLQLNLGTHYAAYLVNNKFYNSLQPRLSGRYLLSPSWSLKASYVYMEQYIHLLTNSAIGLPTDLWVTSTENIDPQRSHQAAIGTTLSFGKSKWEFTNELFYKDLKGLIAYKPSASIAPATNWENQIITNGKGSAYGWESFLRYNSKKTNGWVAYTLSKSTRQFAELNEGEKFPFKYDRRHDLKIVLNRHFTKKFSLGLTWIFNTGIRATIPISTYVDLNGVKVIRFSKRNDYQYPNYHRLDVNMNWKKKTNWGERNWGLSIYNAYNRRNPFLIYFDLSGTSRNANQISLFPFLPSFYYNFKF